MLERLNLFDNGPNQIVREEAETAAATSDDTETGATETDCRTGPSERESRTSGLVERDFLLESKTDAVVGVEDGSAKCSVEAKEVAPSLFSRFRGDNDISSLFSEKVDSLRCSSWRRGLDSDGNVEAAEIGRVELTATPNTLLTPETAEACLDPIVVGPDGLRYLGCDPVLIRQRVTRRWSLMHVLGVLFKL